jgi:hypothetical protein
MGGAKRIETRDAFWGGLIACLAGGIVIGMAIWGDDTGFHAPRWVVAAAGATFLFAGMAIIGQDYPLFSGILRALLLTCFGGVFTWVSFGPGERQFTSTISLPLLSFTSGSSSILGRICFAPGAILLDGLALYAWFLIGRDWLFKEQG